MGTCADCKFYSPHYIWMEGDSDELKKWGKCCNPKLDISGNDSFIQAGGDDGYGDYFRMTKDFGCIFFEGK